jgi:hypothetical protein
MAAFIKRNALYETGRAALDNASKLLYRRGLNLKQDAEIQLAWATKTMQRQE